MGRRSDHSRTELEALILEQAHAHMAEVGFARFSAREVAKRIGYSVGTLYNVYGTLDRLLEAVNTHTFSIWTHDLERDLPDGQDDRIAALVSGYFRFARRNVNLWNAIYDHHLPPDVELEDEDRATRARLTGTVASVVATSLPESRRNEAEALTRSLVATVHGHCALELGGSYALMGSVDGRGEALARVREALGHGRSSRTTTRRRAS